MVTRELLDYIELELKSRKSKDQISEVLIKEGWKSETVDLAFEELKSSKNYKQKYFNKKNLIFIFIGLFLIISSILINIGSMSINPTKNNTKIKIETTTKLSPTLKSSLQPSITTPSEAYNGQSGGNCGTEEYLVDMDDNNKKSFPKLECFIAAARVCNPATLTLNSKVFAYGVSTNSQVAYRITKGNNGCVLNINQGKITFQIPPGIPESILEPITTSLKKMENTQGVCTFANNEDLVSVFEKLNKSEFSLQTQTTQNIDFLKGDCSGTYFTAANEVSESLQ